MPRMTEAPSPIKHPVDYIYYRLDLFGPDGTPANSKVLSSWGFFAALSAVLWWGYHLSVPVCASTDGEFVCSTPAGVTWPYVTLVIGLFTVAAGKDVFKVFLKRGGWGSGADDGGDL